MLRAVCQVAIDRLASKDKTFAQRMSLRNSNTLMAFSNQLHPATTHAAEFFFILISTRKKIKPVGAIIQKGVYFENVFGTAQRKG